MALLIALSVPLGPSPSSVPDIVYTVAGAVLFLAIMLRIGLLAGVFMLIAERLLTRLPLTLDLHAWYLGSSLMVVLLVLCDGHLRLPRRGCTTRRTTAAPVAARSRRRRYRRSPGLQIDGSSRISFPPDSP